MKLVVYLSLIALLSGCNQNDSREQEQLRREKALVQKERELLARERALNQKASSSTSPKVVDPASAVVDSPPYPTEQQITKDLLGRKIRQWNFDALSEFKNTTLVKQQATGDYWEGTLDMDLESYKNGDDYFMRLFVAYSLVNGEWLLQKYDAVDFHKK